MGSPGLKESFEAHLSDVLNDMPVDENDTNAPLSGDCDQVDKNSTQANRTAVEEIGAAELDVPIVGMEKVVPPRSSSSFAPPSVSLAQEDSQDSILDIKGFGDDGKVSLMGWNAEDAGGLENGNSTDKVSIAAVSPKHNKDSGYSTKPKDFDGSWRSLVHRDDPFLCLVPCEIAQVAAALQDHQFNHLKTFRHLGFCVSGV